MNDAPQGLELPAAAALTRPCRRIEGPCGFERCIRKRVQTCISLRMLGHEVGRSKALQEATHATGLASVCRHAAAATAPAPSSPLPCSSDLV